NPEGVGRMGGFARLSAMTMPHHAMTLLDNAGHAERRVEEGSVGLDVWAHDEDVARLERRVLLEQVRDDVAEHLDLARLTVAGVDLDAPVLGRELPTEPLRLTRSVVPGDVALEQPEQRLRTAARRMSIDHRIASINHRRTRIGHAP